MPQKIKSTNKYLFNKLVLLLLNCIFMGIVTLADMNLIGLVSVVAENVLLLTLILTTGKTWRAVDFVPAFSLLNLPAYAAGNYATFLELYNREPNFTFPKEASSSLVITIVGLSLAGVLLLGAIFLPKYLSLFTVIGFGMIVFTRVVKWFAVGESFSEYKMMNNVKVILIILVFLMLLWMLGVGSAGASVPTRHAMNAGVTLVLTAAFVYLVRLQPSFVENRALLYKNFYTTNLAPMFTWERVFLFSFALLFYTFVISVKNYGFSGDISYFAGIAVGIPFVRLLTSYSGGEKSPAMLFTEFLLVIAAFAFYLICMETAIQKGFAFRFAFEWLLVCSFAIYFMFHSFINLFVLIAVVFIIALSDGNKGLSVKAKSLVVEITAVVMLMTDRFFYKESEPLHFVFPGIFLLIVLIANLAIGTNKEENNRLTEKIPVAMMIAVVAGCMVGILK